MSLPTGGRGRMIATDTVGAQLTSRQRRELGVARAQIGDSVLAYTAGRARARWTTTARSMLALFVALFLLLLFAFHVILIPGALLIYLLYDAVKPRRGLTVLPDGVAEVKLSLWNGAPRSVITTAAHEALLAPHVVRDEHGTGVRFGEETICVNDADLERLRSAVSYAGAPPLPAPPGGAPASGGVEDDRVPRWREGSALRVLGHVVLAS